MRLVAGLSLIALLSLGCGGQNKVEMPTQKFEAPPASAIGGVKSGGSGGGFPKVPDRPPDR